jgi:hypothetical protein
MFGPLLKYNNVKPNNIWSIHILIGIEKNIKPTVNVIKQQFTGNIIHTYQKQNMDFWRFEINIQLRKWETQYTYSIKSIDNNTLFFIGTFHVPGIKDNWNISFFTCNGFENKQKEDEITKPWLKMMETHKQKHIHLLIGAGDQAYFDDIFKIPFLQYYIDNYKNITYIPSNIEKTIDEYYIDTYIKHFSNEGLKEILANVPFMFIWDDHDIIDGWGSYKENFLNSEICKIIYKYARKYYLLFQQLCKEYGDNYLEIGLVPTMPPPKDTSKWEHHLVKITGYNMITACMDNRSARTLTNISTIQAYNTIFNEIDKILHQYKNKFKHLLFVIAIPIAGFPNLQYVENIVKYVNPITKALKLNNGYTKNIDLLDDLQDRWESKYHINERTMLIKLLKEIANVHNIRITIASGDVHCGGFGTINNWTINGMVKKECKESFMQIISSPIGNNPMNSNIVSFLNIGRFPKKICKDATMGVVLNNGNMQGLIPKRNWCLFNIDKKLNLNATLFIENKLNCNLDNWKTINIIIPSLE